MSIQTITEVEGTAQQTPMYPSCNFNSYQQMATGEGNGNPLQYSRLENPMDRGAWQATVHGIEGLNMTVGLTFTFSH